MRHWVVLYLNLSFFLLFLPAAYAQQKPETESTTSSLPVVSLAYGSMNFFGDLGNTKLSEPFLSHHAFQIEIQKHTEKRLSFAVFLLSGNVGGEEKTVDRTLNFKSSIVAEGIMLRYDFISRSNSNQIIIPYLTAGIEYMFFDTKSDLKDENGNPYHYWADGTIRSIAETDSLASQATLLHRDYTYETSVRDANLDGFGKYRTSAPAFPIGAGFRLQLSDKFSMHFSSVYHLVSSDYLDGITADGTGERKGNSKNDNILFTSVSFRFDIGSGKSGGGRLNDLVNEDSDSDGIPDIRDDSAATPVHNKVDVAGKPLDGDDDGIPDYRDKELTSVKGALVNEDGITITEAMIEEKFRKDSLAALPAIIEYIKSVDRLTEMNPEAAKMWETKTAKSPGSNHTQVPAKYSRFDTDTNGVISPKEIGVAIQEYLDNKSPYTIPEFYDLIDFFFHQH